MCLKGISSSRDAESFRVSVERAPYRIVATSGSCNALKCRIVILKSLAVPRCSHPSDGPAFPCCVHRPRAISVSERTRCEHVSFFSPKKPPLVGRRRESQNDKRRLQRLVFSAKTDPETSKRVTERNRPGTECTRAVRNDREGSG